MVNKVAMKTGLCSITFRHLDAEEIAVLVNAAGLDAVEWGGDAHVPAGDLKMAEVVRRITADAGLETAAYGSYYRVVDSAGQPQPFDPVLETAIALGAETIRIWAGRLGCAMADDTYKHTVIDGIRNCAQLAADQNIRIGLEFHRDTLSDSQAATRSLMDAVDHSNLYTYWQPPYWFPDFNERLAGLMELSDRIANVHVFNWQFNPLGNGSWNDCIERRPLSEAKGEWQRYLSTPLSPPFEHYALLEYVRDDDPEQFLKDADTLQACIEMHDL